MNTEILPPLPDHLGGFQHLAEDSIVQLGDMLVQEGNPVAWVGASIGLPVARVENATGCRVYRRMPVAKQGDLDPDHHAEEEPKKARTDDSNKPPMARLPWKALREVSRVQAFGHQKYSEFDNYRNGMEVDRILGCTIRHIAAYMEGETHDPESGLNHLAHAATRLLFALQNDADGVLIDNRFKK